jgi:hypothetical protein
MEKGCGMIYSFLPGRKNTSLQEHKVIRKKIVLYNVNLMSGVLGFGCEVNSFYEIRKTLFLFETALFCAKAEKKFLSQNAAVRFNIIL